MSTIVETILGSGSSVKDWPDLNTFFSASANYSLEIFPTSLDIRLAPLNTPQDSVAYRDSHMRHTSGTELGDILTLHHIIVMNAKILLSNG